MTQTVPDEEPVAAVGCSRRGAPSVFPENRFYPAATISWGFGANRPGKGLEDRKIVWQEKLFVWY